MPGELHGRQGPQGPRLRRLGRQDRGVPRRLGARGGRRRAAGRRRAERPARRHHRRGPVGPDVRRGPAAPRPRGRRLRGLPQGGRRPRLRHPRVSPSEGHRPGRGGQPREDGSPLRVRHDRRPDAHGGRPLRRRLRRRLRRDGRGPPLLRQRPGRGPERRLLGQRVPDPREPHGRVPLPARRTRRSCAATTWRSWAAATWRWTPRARRCGSARRTSTSSTAARAPRCPPGSKRSTTPRRRASSSGCSTRPSRSSARRTAGCAALKVQKCELGEPDEKGRRRPVPIEGAYEELPVEIVIEAIGNGPEPADPEDDGRPDDRRATARSSWTRRR